MAEGWNLVSVPSLIGKWSQHRGQVTMVALPGGLIRGASVCCCVKCCGDACRSESVLIAVGQGTVH